MEIKDEKLKKTIRSIVIGIVCLALVVGFGGAAWYRHQYNDLRSQIDNSAGRSIVVGLQNSLDAAAAANEQLKRELGNAADNAEQLGTILTGALRSAESGLESVRSARQSTSGIAGTAEQLRKNYELLGASARASEANYQELIRQLKFGESMGGPNGGQTPGK